ncbi:hypothetical protein SAMN04487939_11467 [Lysobacter sp. yr284]|nr:hypothetical protein SAMN04487939_11467 [Lysobacter sp. yr284]
MSYANPMLASYIALREKHFAGNVITEPLHSDIWGTATDASFTYPQMNYFMEQGKRPSRLCILVIYYNEWSYVVSKRKTSKNLRLQRCVMTTEVSNEKNKYPDALCRVPQHCKCRLRSSSPAKLRQVKSNNTRDVARNITYAMI